MSQVIIRPYNLDGSSVPAHESIAICVYFAFIFVTHISIYISNVLIIYAGLTWFLGYLAISDARLPFQYAFTILNSLQGFFIFILFVLRKKRVRDQWLILCCCKIQEQEKALRSLSASGSIPSTGSGRSSYSGRSERSDSTRTTTSFVNDSYDSLFFPFKASRSSLYFREKSHSVTSE